ncbi:sensor histidine kinase [Methylomarinum vadi]|uniref:sensor histidine kinase n=1 Tax=Methylomarinum vadi TaxID=438855 RepID=UPI0004DEEEB0|nr:ATP-binding protein [Methylomarinum vadi]
MALRPCLDNLINNGLRYSNGSQIDVVCRLFQQTLYLGVRDRGPGIPSLVRAMPCFGRFIGSNSRNRATGGSGFGLAITRQLVETQGWQVALKTRRGGVSAWLQIRLHDHS